MLAIDLSLSRKSGYAYFEHGRIKTGLAGDEELMKMAEEEELVGIDAPLSLPAGRKSIEERGAHFRECDLMLRRMGIRFFPITIGAMRRLTKKGMEMAERLREIGVNVVEIFPGASLDMIGIERKNIEGVSKFLEPFGAKLKSIDESDAAIGLFTLWLHKKGLSLRLKGKDGEIVISPPALSLGRLVEGEFLERLNRFVIKVRVNGKEELAYMRDTGRMGDYLWRGNRVFLSGYRGKFKHMLKAVELGKEKVMADPFLDIGMAKGYLRMKGIKATQKGMKRKSLFDLAWKNCIAEVKGANMRRNSIALFPDVYSKRAERHFRELRDMEGCRYIIFVAHLRAKGISINPAFPSLKALLREAIERGVEVKGISTVIEGNYWIFEKEIPVIA